MDGRWSDRVGGFTGQAFSSTLLSSIREGVAVFDDELRIRIWNPFMESLIGVPASDVVGRQLLDAFPEVEEHEALRCLAHALDGESSVTEAARFKVSASGEHGWVTVRYDPFRNDAGDIVGVISIVQDIGEKHRAELALAASERLLAIYADIADVFLTVPDEEMYERVMAIVLRALDSKLGFFGYIDDEGNLVCPSMTEKVFEQCRMSDKTNVFPRESWGGTLGESLRTESSILSNEAGRVPDGHIGIERSIVVPIIDRETLIGLLAVANRETDYTDDDLILMESIVDRVGPILHARLDRVREERDRIRALEEKDALLKEVHHRVKNNMAVISSLVSLQRDDLGEPETVDVLTRLHGRIRAMALVHEQIYRSGDFREIDLGKYAENLVNALFQTRADLVGKVRLETRITDVVVALDLAVPCGLILNELINNSLEHAFPGDRRGGIVVALDRSDDRRARLSVVDDGVGSEGRTAADRCSGFGLQLVELLTKQLGGELEMSFDHGSDVRVTFLLDD